MSISAIVASIDSERLCGGILVAIPTAIPDAPFIKRLGIRVGNTTGSLNVSSKLFLKSTVSLSISRNISSASLAKRASV